MNLTRRKLLGSVAGVLGGLMSVKAGAFAGAAEDKAVIDSLHNLVEVWVYGTAGPPPANTMKIGTNLTAGIGPGTTENPFINILKTGAGWTPVTGSAPNAWVNDAADTFTLYTSWLDSDGYVTTFSGASFTGVATTVLNNWPSPFYKSGTYIFLYDGVGSFDFLRDATYVSGAGTGRIVLSVAPTAQGIAFVHYATGAGANKATNFRLVYSGDEAALASGEIFTPEFISKVGYNKAFRFMKWQGIDSQNYQVNWADRTPQSYVFWVGSRLNAVNNACDPNAAIDGVPVEVMCALCNKLNADAWFCMPPLTTDDYKAQFATLVHSTLNSPLKAYVEYANELWNQQLGVQSLGAITGSVAGSTLTITAMPSNGFGGPYLRGGVAGIQINDNQVNIPGNEIQIVAQLTGTPGGLGTYSLSKSISTVSSQAINIVLQGVTQVSNLCLNAFPYLQSLGPFSNSQLNNLYSCYGHTRSWALWKSAWGVDAARMVRIFGGFSFNDAAYNQAQLTQSVANIGAETASFTGTLSGTSLTASSVTGTIVIGHLVTGTGVSAATYIQSGSGTSWVVNKSQTVGPISMSSEAWVDTVASNMTPGVDALAVDAYFGNVTVPNTATLNQLFTEILSGGEGWVGSYPGGVLKQRFDQTAINFATAQNPSYGNGILIVNYEGGWGFSAGSDIALNTLFENAQSDARMQTVYTNLLTGMQTQGSTLFVNFTDISPHVPAPFGFDWGALTTVLQASSFRQTALSSF
jgi:hypothetical protein